MTTVILALAAVAGFGAAFFAPRGLGRGLALFGAGTALLLTIPLEIPEEPVFRAVWVLLYACLSGLLLSEALYSYRTLYGPERGSESGTAAPVQEGETGSGYYFGRVSKGAMLVDFALGSLMLGLAVGAVL